MNNDKNKKRKLDIFGFVLNKNSRILSKVDTRILLSQKEFYTSILEKSKGSISLDDQLWRNDYKKRLNEVNQELDRRQKTKLNDSNKLPQNAANNTLQNRKSAIVSKINNMSRNLDKYSSQEIDIVRTDILHSLTDLKKVTNELESAKRNNSQQHQL